MPGRVEFVMSWRDNPKSRITKLNSLTVYKRAKEVVIEVYKLSEQLPSDEKFGMTSQLRRAAQSVVNNIAEGQARQTKADQRHFTVIARGSLSELVAILDIAVDLGFVSELQLDNLGGIIQDLDVRLFNLISSKQ